MGTECEFDRTGSRRSSRVSSERQVTDTLLPETPPQSNGRSGRLCKVPDYGNLRVGETQKPLVRIALLMANVVEGFP